MESYKRKIIDNLKLNNKLGVDIVELHSPRCVGIDFGTTNSLVSFIGENNQIEFINFNNPYKKNRFSTVEEMNRADMTSKNQILRSLVGYSAELSFFNDQAKDFEYIDGPKRFISNINEEDSFESKFLDGIKYLLIGGRWRSIIEICSDLLLHMRHTTNAQLMENIRNAVLCVPARFDEYQRRLLVNAAEMAGWRILRVISEPTAGFLGQKDLLDGTFGVCDLGGGTFDFSIVKSNEQIIQVIYTNGNTQIGAHHLDRFVFDYFSKKYDSIKSVEQIKEFREFGILNNIPEGSEKEIIDFISIHSKKIADDCISIIQKAPQIFSEIILIGGAFSLLEGELSKLGYKAKVAESPELQVARGAARQAYKLQGEASPYLLLDVTPLSLGIETINDEVEWIIRKNSRIPVAKRVIFTNFHEKQTHIKFKVVQGEGRLASRCRNLGEFEIEIQQRKPGSIKIELTFIVDTNGMIQIKAKNIETEEIYKIELSSAEGLSEELIKSIMD